MKKILLLILFIFSNVVSASSFENSDDTISPFPNAKRGINIVPLAEMNLPNEMKDEIIADKKAHAANSYRITSDTDNIVNFLLNLNTASKEDLLKFDNDKNPYDTHLKSSVSKINLAFNFKGIPGIPKDNVIGFAAAGGCSKEKGWDGIVEFITDAKMGVCSYTTYTIVKVILDKETTEYLINNKPTIESVAGNRGVGFLYTLNWYMPNRFMSLQCANKTYDATNISKMLILAKGIDKEFK